MYADEFHSFITPSLAEILSGSRKYHLGLVLAHQELRQLEKDQDVASAVLSNSYTRVIFRVGDHDARALADSLSTFDSSDLQNLAIGEAICRIERNDFDFNLCVERPERPESGWQEQVNAVVEASRRKYAVLRRDIEAALSVPNEEVSKPKSETPMPTAKAASGPPADVTPKVEPQPVPQQVAVPSDLGRGGVQHKAIQMRAKEAAEGLGFRVHVERRILDDAGSVDLVLERGGQSIACEITVTNTIDYEVGNVSKCVKAGFRTVAVVGTSEDKLGKLASAVSMSLGEEVASQVRYFLPDAFIKHLETLKPSEPPQTEVRVSHGYKVKRNYVAVSAQEAKEREERLIKLVSDKMKAESAKK